MSSLEEKKIGFKGKKNTKIITFKGTDTPPVFAGTL